MTRYMPAIAAGAVLIAGSASAALAQTPESGVQGQQQLEQRGERAGQREEDRLREVLRGAGFSRIRVLDAAYVVHARAPDGRSVIMYIDPPARTTARSGGEDMSRDRGTTSSMGSQQETRLRKRDRDQDQPAAATARELEPLTPQAARSILRARGVADIQDLRLEGDEYRATASFLGVEVDVRVHARTGVVEVRSS